MTEATDITGLTARALSAAIRGRDEISSPLSYAAHLTEIMLLGVVSLRAKAKLHYDGAAMKVTNNDSANEFLTRAYREGYSL